MSFALKLDPASAVPLWHQIELGLRRLFATGALRAGAKVPSVRELAADLRVNPATVVKAYQVLTDAGLLQVRRGEGTYASEAAPLPAARSERQKGLREAAAEFVVAARVLGANQEQALREVGSAWRRDPAGEK
jgi:GntR family transcriptional regulator